MKHFNFLNSIILFSVCTLLLSGCFFGNRLKSGAADPTDNTNVAERYFTNFQMEALKNATTVFFLREADKNQKHIFEKTIRETWKFNDIIIADYYEKSKYNKGNFAYLMLSCYEMNAIDSVQQKDTKQAIAKREKKSKDDKQSISPEVFLTLSMPLEVRDKKNVLVGKGINFTRTDMYPGANTEAEVIAIQDLLEIEKMLYGNSVIYNWTPGLLKTYLKEIQNQLLEFKRPYLHQEIDNGLNALSRNTLYIPDYTCKIVNKHNGDLIQMMDADELLEDYPFDYEIISATELSELILSGIELYFLDPVVTYKSKYTKFYSTSKGKIYQLFDKKSMQFSPKDFKEIGKLARGKGKTKAKKEKEI